MGREHPSETQVLEASSRYSLPVEIREQLQAKVTAKGTTDNRRDHSSGKSVAKNRAGR
jgi:NADPH-dependent curcumin reductase CurA